MAKRKSRKQRYQETVVGKLGAVDFISIDPNADYYINKRGGKVYSDISKHTFLDIPNNTEGMIYDVLSVGNHHNGEPIVTIIKGDLVQVYRLPSDYNNWANHLRMNSLMGTNPFPCKVEFGKNATRYYAEFVI